MESTKTRSEATQRTRSVVFVGLTIAIMAVSAWVVVPLGPIPFTLQMFAITFAIVVLSPKEAIAAITGYLLLGAVGVPVFSGMRGGIGVLAGPTGGFLWGYLFGVAAAALFLHAVRTRLGMAGGKNAPRLTRAEKTAMTPLQRAGAFLRSFGVEIIAGIIFTAIAYVCGCVQYWWWGTWIWPRRSSRRWRRLWSLTSARSWPPSSAPTPSAPPCGRRLVAAKSSSKCQLGPEMVVRVLP